MRNATIRRKHARAERLWVRFMTQPQRLIVGASTPTIQEWATMPGRLWSNH